MASAFADLAKSVGASFLGAIGMTSAKEPDDSYAARAKKRF